MSGINIKPSMLSDAIAGVLAEYGEEVYIMTEEGLETAEKILIRNLKTNTPKKTGRLARSWKSSGKKYKLFRLVYNDTTVKMGKKDIPLINVLEYGKKHGKPFVKKTYDNSVEEMAKAVVETIKRGG